VHSHTNTDKRIFITHCSAKKDDSLEGSDIKVRPDKLYTATPTKRFMDKCKDAKVNWAIFSDKYGIWFSKDFHEWYEKNPKTITDEEFRKLVKDFDEKLNNFVRIWFYYNPGRFHSLYKKLLDETTLKHKIKTFLPTLKK
jgi:hypothetical protein